MPQLLPYEIHLLRALQLFDMLDNALILNRHGHVTIFGDSFPMK